MSVGRDYVSVTDGAWALLRQDGVTRLEGAHTMNVHESLLSEISRQRRQDMLDDHKHWTSRVRLRRRNQREQLA